MKRKRKIPKWLTIRIWRFEFSLHYNQTMKQLMFHIGKRSHWAPITIKGKRLKRFAEFKLQ